MIVLHLAVCRTGLLVWAETDQFKQNMAQRGNHPFALSASQLRSVLEYMGIFDPKKPQCESFSMRATLPSGTNAPLPSTPSLGNARHGRAKGLRHWRVGALMPDHDQCMRLMRACRNQHNFGDQEFLAADDAVFWSNAVEFALELTASGRYLPTVEHDSQHYYARWQPVIQDQDSLTFDQLAASMPASGRALTHMHHPQDDQMDPRTALRTLIERVLDHTVRVGLQQVPPTRKAGEKHAHMELPHDDLVYALTKTGKHRLTGSPRRNATTANAINSWKAKAKDNSKAPARLCVRLMPPSDDLPPSTARWTLQLLLQAKHDLSLTVTAKQVWKGGHHALQEPGFLPKRFLSEECERTARFSHAMRRAAAQEAPHTVSLNINEAHLFLTEEAATLTENGVTVLLPKRWNQQIRISADSSPSPAPATPAWPRS